MLHALWRRVKVKLHFWMIDCCKQCSAGMISIAKTVWNTFYITFIQIFCNLKTCSSSRNCHPTGGIFVYSALDMVMITSSLRTLSAPFLSRKLFRFWKLPNHKVLEIDIIAINSFLINKFQVLKEFSFSELSFSFPILITILQNYNVALNCP